MSKVLIGLLLAGSFVIIVLAAAVVMERELAAHSFDNDPSYHNRPIKA